MASKPYLGVGIKHPHEIDQFGKIVLTDQDSIIQQSLRTLFNTPIGTEFGREHYGSNIRQAMFEPNDQVAKTILDYYITDAIANWERRIKLVDILYETPDSAPELIKFMAVYLVKQASNINSFVYPFYRQLKN